MEFSIFSISAEGAYLLAIVARRLATSEGLAMTSAAAMAAAGADWEAGGEGD
jgi:hypothetical protein